jgi:hypothetical protein
MVAMSLCVACYRQFMFLCRLIELATVSSNCGTDDWRVPWSLCLDESGRLVQAFGLWKRNAGPLSR